MARKGTELPFATKATSGREKEKIKLLFSLRTDYLKLESKDNLPATSPTGGKAVQNFLSPSFPFLDRKKKQTESENLL